MSKKYLNSPLKLKKYPHKSHLFPKEIQALAVVLKKKSHTFPFFNTLHRFLISNQFWLLILTMTEAKEL